MARNDNKEYGGGGGKGNGGGPHSVTEIMNYMQKKVDLNHYKKIKDVPAALPLIRRISHMNTQDDELFKKVRLAAAGQ